MTEKLLEQFLNKKEMKEYNYTHSPEHYNNTNVEAWVMMLKIWGPEAFIKHCEMTAFKYRMRLGSKPNEPIERDLEKAKWYENKAKEIKDEFNI